MVQEAQLLGEMKATAARQLHLQEGVPPFPTFFEPFPLNILNILRPFLSPFPPFRRSFPPGRPSTFVRLGVTMGSLISRLAVGAVAVVAAWFALCIVRQPASTKHIYRPWYRALMNAIMGPLSLAGVLPTRTIRAEECIKQAVKAANCSDFGENNQWRENLDRFLTKVHRDSHRDAAGSFILRGKIISVLTIKCDPLPLHSSSTRALVAQSSTSLASSRSLSLLCLSLFSSAYGLMQFALCLALSLLSLSRCPLTGSG